LLLLQLLLLLLPLLRRAPISGASTLCAVSFMGAGSSSADVSIFDATSTMGAKSSEAVAVRAAAGGGPS
jgi:hypothetical protein